MRLIIWPRTVIFVGLLVCAAVGSAYYSAKIDVAVGNFSWKRSQTFRDAAVLWKNLGSDRDVSK